MCVCVCVCVRACVLELNHTVIAWVGTVINVYDKYARTQVD